MSFLFLVIARVAIVGGKRFQFYLLPNFELPLQYVQNLKFFWECKDLESLKL